MFNGLAESFLKESSAHSRNFQIAQIVSDFNDTS